MGDDQPASYSVVIVATPGDVAMIVGWLHRIATLAGPPREVCIVHGPLPGVIEAEIATRVKLLEEPLGRIAAAHNLGLAAAAGDVVVFPSGVSSAADLFGLLGREFADRSVAAVFAAPACVAFRRVDLEAIHGFDESQRGDDDLIDACRRLEAAGRKVAWTETPAAPPEQSAIAASGRCLITPGIFARRRRGFLPLVSGPTPSDADTQEARNHQVDVAPAAAGGSRCDPGDPDPWGESRRALRRVWAEHLPPGTHAALAGYPDHWNVGDAAIWWGTRRLLADLGVAIDYACDPWSYEPTALEAAVPHGPILILGGGNLGDAYRHEQSLRERILRDFRQRRIIQLPQSIWFASSQRAEAMADLFLHAGDVTLLLRDAASLASARAMFQCDSALCPDSALALELTRRWRPPETPLLALWRTDTEAREPSGESGDDVVVTDWTTPGLELDLMSTAARGFHEWVGPPPAEVGSCPRRRRLAWRHLPWLWDQLAEDRTLRGCRILSRGRVVLTDRLHAHLLCAAMRKPHVVCDSGNGKIFAYRDTWRIDDPLVRFASNRAEAVRLGRELLASTGSQEDGDDGP